MLVTRRRVSKRGGGEEAEERLLEERRGEEILSSPFAPYKKSSGRNQGVLNRPMQAPACAASLRTEMDEKATEGEVSFKARYEALALESQRRQAMDGCLLDVLERERSLVTKLLYTMVPPKIARDLSNGLPVAPELFKYCVVFFSDIEGFTAFGDGHTAIEVFDMLNSLFSVMDYVTTCFPTLYKVETVGE